VASPMLLVASAGSQLAWVRALLLPVAQAQSRGAPDAAEDQTHPLQHLLLLLLLLLLRHHSHYPRQRGGVRQQSLGRVGMGQCWRRGCGLVLQQQQKQQQQHRQRQGHRVRQMGRLAYCAEGEGRLLLCKASRSRGRGQEGLGVGVLRREGMRGLWWWDLG